MEKTGFEAIFWSCIIDLADTQETLKIDARESIGANQRASQSLESDVYETLIQQYQQAKCARTNRFDNSSSSFSLSHVVLLV